MGTPQPLYAPRPSFQDWALLTISLIFVVIGLFMLVDEPRKASDSLSAK